MPALMRMLEVQAREIKTALSRYDQNILYDKLNGTSPTGFRGIYCLIASFLSAHVAGLKELDDMLPTKPADTCKPRALIASAEF